MKNTVNSLKLARFLILFLGFLAVNANAFAESAPPAELISPSIEIVRSPYSAVIVEAISKWKQLKPDPQSQCKKLLADENEALAVQALDLAEGHDYIGALQKMCIGAEFKTVVEVLRKFSAYSELFPNLKSVTPTRVDGLKRWLNWEVRVPVFFVPNFTYSMVYLVDDARQDEAIFRYHLAGGEKMKASDGVIFVNRAGPEGSRETLYTEYDFFNADWGAMKTFASHRIWEDSLSGLIQSDLAIKVKAEHPDWSEAKARDEAETRTQTFPVLSTIRTKKKFQGWDTFVEFKSK